MYAAGRIPGSFFKREGRPGEAAILTCRLTDRPLRPTFADGLRNEVQVVNTVLQTAQFDPYDVVAMNGSSLATMLSGIPFSGPVASVRYALNRNGDWIAFPSFEELEEDVVFQMVIAGRVEDDGEVAILMIEAEATEDAVVKIDMGAPKPTEERIGEAIQSVKPIIKDLCEAQQAFVDKVGVRQVGEFQLFLDYETSTFDRIDALAGDTVARDLRRRVEQQGGPRREAAGRQGRGRRGLPRRAGRGRRPRGPRQAGAQRLPLGREEGRPQDRHRDRRPHRRARHGRHPGADRRGRRPARTPTAPASSSAARPRSSVSWRSAPPATGSASTPSTRSRRSCTCTTTTCPPTRPVRPAGSGRPSGARSGTGRWRSVRSSRSCRTRTCGPTPCASSPTCSAPTARPRWGRSVAPRWR